MFIPVLSIKSSKVGTQNREEQYLANWSAVIRVGRESQNQAISSYSNMLSWVTVLGIL